jgi:hypothetical protein
MVAGHPDPIVRQKATDLAVAAHNAFNSAVWAIRDMGGSGNGVRTSLTVAKGDHDAADAIAQELVKESARYGGG